ncbi:MAG: glutamate--tRNA ligase, partial [Candidatus Pacebacteria bacterium]|nr:glutamate--tRNA ligase [Candidatus Paceibacterota bacterium]
MNNIKKIRTRIAPSPTGHLHIGTVRTALFNYLFAKQNGGQIILRIEDTDKKRSKQEYENDILEGFEWLGIGFDEKYWQSARTKIYKKYLQKLITDGKAYISKEEAGEGKREEVIRFKNPNTKISFVDLIRGRVEFDSADLGDFVIAKSLDEPLYNFAVVVDDCEMKISHIIRGEDHISNTPRQILIQEALGAPRFNYAHLPLILAPDRSKMSKRHNAVSVNEYRKAGYLPEALVNYTAFLGWNPGTEQEIFIMDELVEKFNLSKVQKGGAIFNPEKLNWINKEHIKLMTNESFEAKILEFLPVETKKMALANDKMFSKILPLIRERIEKFEDAAKMAKAGDWDYYFKRPEYEKEKLLWKDESDLNNVKKHLKKIIELLEKTAVFENEKIKESLWDYATEEGRGFVLWPTRFALSGCDKS